MSPPPRRWGRSLRRALGFGLLWSLGLLLGLGIGAWQARDELATRGLRALGSRRAPPGFTLTLRAARLLALDHLRLEGMALSAPDDGAGAPLSLEVEAVDVVVERAALWRGELRLRSVELLRPRALFDPARGPKALLALGRGRVGEAPARAAEEEGGADQTVPASWPTLRVVGGSLRLRGRELGIDELDLQMTSEGEALRLAGHLSPQGMPGGPCELAGSVARSSRTGSWRLRCRAPLELRHGDLTLRAADLAGTLGQPPPSLFDDEERARLVDPWPDDDARIWTLGLQGLEVVAPVPGDPQPRVRLSGAARLLLRDHRRLGVEARLGTEAGGRVLVAGRVRPLRREGVLDLRVEDLDLARSPLPALLPGRLEDGLLDADLALDLSEGGERLDLTGALRLTGLSYFHDRLARDSVQVAVAAADLDLLLDLAQHRFEMVASRFQVGGVPLEVDGELDLGRGPARVRLSAFTGEVSGKDLVEAVPAALRPRLAQIQLEGRASFGGSLLLDMARPDDLEIKLHADTRDLHAESLGRGIDLRNLAGPFIHVWEDEEREEVYRFETGPGSPAWVGLGEVPPILPIALLAQEDGGFYKHKGFSMLHVRGSLIRNLREGRFARGASTLSMQLARNLFLGREKRIARKLQEVVLAWALEQELSKDEILELYLNVIEWGPGVFGLRAAADHYFGKPVSSLSVAECVFLTTAVPRPRWVHRDFLKGRISRSHQRRIERVLRLLVKRQHLSEAAGAAAARAEIGLRPASEAPALPNLWKQERRSLRGAHGVAPAPPKPVENLPPPPVLLLSPRPAPGAPAEPAAPEDDPLQGSDGDL